MQNIHLMLAAVWAVIAAGLVIWSIVEPARDQLMLIIVTGILTFYNLARWLASRKRTPEPWRPRRHQREDEPPNPDFDFSKEPRRE